MGGLVSHTQRKEAKSEEVTVYIYESEYRQIQAWVDKHQNLETGGDLFGLWADDHTAVVQLVLGPGEHCTRTSASFYQDVKYLERVGNLLTYQEGLCHIGEWHSHHRLGLEGPSRGDKNTVWRNMDRYGIHRFCLFIATIQSSWSHKGSIQDYVSVNGFIFKTTANKHRFLKLSPCKFISPPEKSPFRLKYNDDINEGVESINKERDLQKAEVADKRGKHADQPPKEAERREYVNDEGGHLQAYVPVENKTTMKGQDEYHAMELVNVVKDEEPEDNSQRSGICCSSCRFCPMCLLVNCQWA